MPPVDRRDVDPSVTDDDFDLALDGDPAPFPDVSHQDNLDDAFAEARALLGVVPATPAQAISHARDVRRNHTFVGVGMCLATVRGFWDLPAMWPDAQTAIDHGAPVHRTTDPLKVPRGASVVWQNGRHGHIALGLGGGLCATTDFHESGFVGVAMIGRLGPWCGGDLLGWIETVNGFDVWPDPNKPKPEPKPWGLPQREREVHRALRRARDHDAGQRRIDGLAAWDDVLLARMADRHLDRLPL